MEVCCAAGAPVTVDYTPKGTFEELGGVPTYVVGGGGKAIIAIYDIFGFKYPQARSHWSDRVTGAAGQQLCILHCSTVLLAALLDLRS